MSDPDDMDKSAKPVSKEHYDRVGATMRGSAIMIAGSGILFGFLLNIRLTSFKFPNFIDAIILLVSIYSVTIAISFFIMPVIFYQKHYQMFHIEKYLSKSKKFLLAGAALMMLTMFLTLGLALHIGIGFEAEEFLLAALPFIFIAIVWIKGIN